MFIVVSSVVDVSVTPCMARRHLSSRDPAWDPHLLPSYRSNVDILASAVSTMLLEGVNLGQTRRGVASLPAGNAGNAGIEATAQALGRLAQACPPLQPDRRHTGGGPGWLGPESPFPATLPASHCWRPWSSWRCSGCWPRCRRPISGSGGNAPAWPARRTTPASRDRRGGIGPCGLDAVRCAARHHLAVKLHQEALADRAALPPGDRQAPRQRRRRRLGVPVRGGR